ncbi:AGAP006323-PA-like protein [Anopheles sinensis]|uniref:AGAP006323-PA-like protein n=1 Tax=Anopheles sinensis TaxID=74873 RepID=A0A084WKC4_ANOSI|nr:AGAP006323-PA-like protein [Anopheles sinensis]
MLRRTRSSTKDQQPCPVKLNKAVKHNSTVATGRLRNITNTVRMSTEQEEEPRGKPSSEPPRKKKRPNSIAGQSTSQPELVAFEKLRVVLGRHYFDVCRRLVLDYVPRCVKQVTECAQHHANKRGPRTKRVGLMRQNHTLEQIPEQRPDQFVEFLYQALMRNEFIDSELFGAGLQLILTINRPSTELQVDYDVLNIVSGTSDALLKCLERFPPCRWDLRAAYQDIVFGHLDADCFKKCDRKEGLFRNIIHLLEFCIETGDPEQSSSHSKHRKGTKKAKQEEDIFFSNYNSWMTQNSQIYDFDKLSRAERFERLFTSLRIIVKMLEMDLAMWILRNPTKTRQNLCLSSRCPLVAQLVWDGDYGSVNLFVKKLFQMYINVIALQYPEENIAILSRLLNLVAVCVNLSEFQHNDGMLQYPCLKTNSEYFAKQLWKTLETSPYYSVNVCLATIHHTRTPFVLLSLSEELIRKLHRHDHPTNIRGFFQHLLSSNWLDCGTEKRAAKTIAGEQSKNPPYPVLNRQKIRTKTSEITQQEYVDLLFVGLRAYCDVYQIPAYFRAIMVQSPNDAETASGENVASDLFPTTVPTAPNRLVKHLRKHESRFPGSTRIVSEDVTDERMIFQGVAVNGELLLEYREDIKYLMLIEQQLKKLKSPEEMRLFRKWITFLSEVDPSLKMNIN